MTNLADILKDLLSPPIIALIVILLGVSAVLLVALWCGATLGQIGDLYVGNELIASYSSSTEGVYRAFASLGRSLFISSIALCAGASFSKMNIRKLKAFAGGLVTVVAGAAVLVVLYLTRYFDSALLLGKLSHIVINTLVDDMVTASKANMETISTEAEEKNISSEDFFMNYENKGFSIEKDKIINFSGKIKKDYFEGLIRESVHHSRDVERMNEKGKYIIRKLFEAYFAHPQQLPDGPILHLLVETAGKDSEYSNIDKVKKLGIGVARSEFNKILENADVRVQSLLMRRICDHIASMTDHYAIEEYNNLYG